MARGASKEQMAYLRTLWAPTRTDPLDRLMAGVERAANGCLIYTADTNRHGDYVYLSCGRGEKRVYGHRLVYERAYGPILDGCHVHHLCENQLCVEITHLTCVTLDEHNRLHGRGVSGPCQTCGYDDWYVRDATGWRQCRECARQRKRERRARRRSLGLVAY